MVERTVDMGGTKLLIVKLTLAIICEIVRGEAQCGITDGGSAYKKYPRLSTVADSEQGDVIFLTCDIAGWFHRSQYIVLLCLASHTDQSTFQPPSPG